MALLYVDGFDNYTASGDITAEISKKATGGAVGSWQYATGRFGGGAAVANSGSDIIYVTTNNHTGIIIVGVYIKFSAIGSASDALISFNNGSIQGNINVIILSTGFLRIRRSSTTLANGTTPISADTWYFMELKSNFTNSGGTTELQLDGQLEATFSGDTTNGGTGITTVNIEGDGNPVCTYDDLYVCDDTGTENNDFLGPIKIESISPDGDGANTDFTPLSGANYTNVDETISDEDTSYVSSSTNNDKDTYTFPNLTDSGAILGIQNVTTCTKQGAGNIEISDVVRVDGTDYLGDDIAVPAGYLQTILVRETNPATETTWLKEELESAEVGFILNQEEMGFAMPSGIPKKLGKA